LPSTSARPRPRSRALAVSIVAAVALAPLAACGGGSGPNFADDHPRIYLGQNRDRLVAALDAGDPAAVRFKNAVDNELDGADYYDFSAWFVALIGQLTGEPRYCDFAVAKIDAVVDAERDMIAGGGTPDVAFDSYLEIGPRIGDLALTYDWCFDRLDHDQAARWLSYASQAVWNVWHHEDATWGGRAAPWSGWSVDNPSNNYYYSFLRATMLLGLAAHGEIPDGDTWLSTFRDDKIEAQLIPTFDADLVGGGSREGTGYGTSMHRLWELYDFWQGSTGEDLAHRTAHTRASLLAFIHATVPTLDRFAPIGDQARDSTASLFDYHRNYVQELAFLFRDDPVAPFARDYLARCSVPEMDQPFMYVYDFLYGDDIAPQSLDGLGRAYVAPGTGEVFARSGWDADATWLNLIAGPLTESHAHHDQGSFMLYKGEWLAYDPIVDSTSGIRQEEELHNLVRISRDGETVTMRGDSTSHIVAVHRGDGWFHVAADLSGAYEGRDDVSSIQRELVFIEPDVVVVFDRVDTAAGTTQTWQLSSPYQPTTSGARSTFAGADHDLRVERVVPATATVSVTDWRDDGDFSGGYRLDVAQAGGARQFLHVVSVDGAAASVTRSDDAGRVGVSITLADGRTAVVRFGADGVDGTLAITGGGGSPVSATLGAGVDALPELE
ncbi:MAG: hypothetical protein KC464_01360, partial [Myxococcales bacterium]|nr:hypothetical protein [Myxococcales bacterium]